MRFPRIDHIYIVHCHQFTERYDHIEKVLQQFDIPSDYYTFVVNTHKDTLSDDIIDEYYTRDTKQRHKELSAIGEDKYLTSNISKGAISCGINHLLIWKTIIQKNHQNYVLVLEDDAITKDNFLSLFLEILAELDMRKHDIVSLEDGCNLKIQKYGIQPYADKQLYKTPDGRMRCTAAYLIQKNTCEKLVKLNTKRKFSLEIDMQMWLYANLGFYNVYWAEPTVFSQGSQKGVFMSEIQPNFTNITRYIEFENKKCVCIGMGFANVVFDLVLNHHCSAVFCNTVGIQNTPKFPIQVIRTQLHTTNACALVKQTYYDGLIDVFAYGENSSDLLKLLVFDTILLNPNVILCSHRYQELLQPRYQMVSEGVFVRHSRVIAEEPGELECID